MQGDTSNILGPLIFAASRGQCIAMCNTLRIFVIQIEQIPPPPPIFFRWCLEGVKTLQMTQNCWPINFGDIKTVWKKNSKAIWNGVSSCWGRHFGQQFVWSEFSLMKTVYVECSNLFLETWCTIDYLFLEIYWYTKNTNKGQRVQSSKFYFWYISRS
jgi:hypothetical protein